MNWSKRKTMEKDLKINLVFLNNQTGLKTQEALKIRGRTKKNRFSEDEINGILGNNWFNSYKNI